MSTNFLQKAIELVTKATELDAASNFAEALKNYEYALEHFMTALKCTPWLGVARRLILYYYSA